jgi:hypothetical protein
MKNNVVVLKSAKNDRPSETEVKERCRFQSSRKSQPDLSVLTQRFRNALKKGVENIVEAGRVLIEARNQLEHGQFSDWVVRELRFGDRREGQQEANIRKAEMLMFLARNDVISNSSHWHALPPSPRTLWELTKIRPPDRLLELIRDGKVHSAMTREDAIALGPHGPAQGSSKAVRKLKTELATLLDVCILLGGSESVRAGLFDLKKAKGIVSSDEFERAVIWTKKKLAAQKGAM